MQPMISYKPWIVLDFAADQDLQAVHLNYPNRPEVDAIKKAA
jgi:hypothetical protein